MKGKINEFLKRNKLAIVIFIAAFIYYVISFAIFTKALISLTGIETLIRIIIIIVGFIYLIYFFKRCFKKIISKKYNSSFITCIISVVLATIILIIAIIINTLYSSISNIGESSMINYTSKLIVLSDYEFDEDSTIGIIDDEDEIEGYQLAHTIIEEENLYNELVEYESYLKMIYDLYSGEIDAIFVQNNYISLYEGEDNLEDISTETKIVYSYSEMLENNDIVESSNKSFDEPLTFLIMGVDSEDEGLDDSASFNGDTLMMVTFNPDTLNLTMFSLPRDLMVPISCNNNSVAKINSSAAGGTSCVINTVENLTGIDIDYYVKINFKGVVDLVDALGGIYVDVEEPDYDTYDGQICEQNSDREFGDSLICIDSGYQLLNGEEALAYSRNRKLYILSDIDRIAHQQDVVTAIANKALEINSYSEFEDVLDAISNNIVTNMSTEQMLSAYDVFKDMITSAVGGNDFLNIEKSYLEYYDLRVYMSSYGTEISALGYYQDSLDDIIEMMEVNLGIEDAEIIKTFSYEIDEEYETEVAGKGYKSQVTYQVLTDFISMTQSEASSYCYSKGISCTFEEVTSTSSHYVSWVSDGTISDQSVRENTLISTISSVTLYVKTSTSSSNSSSSSDSSDSSSSSSSSDETEEEVNEDIVDDNEQTQDDVAGDENLTTSSIEEETIEEEIEQ